MFLTPSLTESSQIVGKLFSDHKVVHRIFHLGLKLAAKLSSLSTSLAFLMMYLSTPSIPLTKSLPLLPPVLLLSLSHDTTVGITSDHS